MGLEILTRAAQIAVLEAAIVADRALCLAADEKTVVEENDPRAAFVLVGKGGTITGETVKRLELVQVDGIVVQKGGVEPEQPKPALGNHASPKAPKDEAGEGKKKRAPAEDKQRKPGENK